MLILSASAPDDGTSTGPLAILLAVAVFAACRWLVNRSQDDDSPDLHVPAWLNPKLLVNGGVATDDTGREGLIRSGLRGAVALVFARAEKPQVDGGGDDDPDEGQPDTTPEPSPNVLEGEVQGRRRSAWAGQQIIVGGAQVQAWSDGRGGWSIPDGAGGWQAIVPDGARQPDPPPPPPPSMDQWVRQQLTKAIPYAVIVSTGTRRWNVSDSTMKRAIRRVRTQGAQQ